MNGYLATAAALTVLIGAMHSWLGERLVFSRMRRDGWVPTDGGTVLGRPHLRILWASWHVVTVLALGCAGLLLWLANPAAAAPDRALLLRAVALVMGACALLVCGGTRGRHPAWVALLAVAALALAGAP
ncbi:MAG: hypothetical protein ACXU8N_06370 [Telluria sp.]